MKGSYLMVIFFFLHSFCSLAQSHLSGVVINSGNKNNLPFVNIGIKLKNIGTTSLTNGSFSIEIPLQNSNDTLTFSIVGFEELNIPINIIFIKNLKLFSLNEKLTQLKPVSIVASKLVEQKIGISNSKSLIRFTDGSTNQNDIFEIAQLIKLDTDPCKITSVNLYLSQARSDSGTFRINFYNFKDNRPAEKIVERSIIQKKCIQEGWMKFDLTEHNIYLGRNVIVAIEFIPSEKKNNPIYYEIKLGGASKSFVRTCSQGDWSIPPHHYRLFITAMTPDDKNTTKRNHEEESETIPSVNFYSKSVKDTFCLFIHTPKNYSKKKHYPLIYLLDANVYFGQIANTMVENNLHAILVGIGYKNILLMDSLRIRDYLYPEEPTIDGLQMSGGATNYLNFIETELMPFIQESYTVDTTNQTLMGHSFGGYFVLYSLLQSMKTNCYLFRNYVAASPSLEYANNYLLNHFSSVNFDTVNHSNLFFTYGGREDSEDGGVGTDGIDGFNRFKNLFSETKFENLNVRSKVYSSYGHMETPIPTFTDYLKLIQ